MARAALPCMLCERFFILGAKKVLAGSLVRCPLRLVIKRFPPGGMTHGVPLFVRCWVGSEKGWEKEC